MHSMLKNSCNDDITEKVYKRDGLCLLSGTCFGGAMPHLPVSPSKEVSAYSHQICVG